MFKERLKKTGIFILANIIGPLLFLILMMAVVTFIGIKAPVIIDITLWGFCIGAGVLLLIGVLVFIHWLFIEPFKKNA